MTLHCASMGDAGPDLVLLHGWGWHGAVWTIAPRLAGRFRVWIPDLPGHGASRPAAVDATLEEWTDAVCSVVPASATWVGWSLGGMIALTAAQRGSAARAAVLGTTPRFTRDVDWDCAWPVEELARFRRGMEQDAAAALGRFASLHLPAGTGARSLLRQLRDEMPVDAASPALCAGLDILRDADLRASLPEIGVPVLVLHGGGDQIVPAAAGRHMARQLPRARYVEVDDAGHALPLSHPDSIVMTIGEFAGG